MNLKWGKKVECPNCHKIFYDMGKQELTCPGSECHYQFINKIDKERLDKIHDNDEEVDLDNDSENEFDDDDETSNELSDDDDDTLTINMKRTDKFMSYVDN